MKNFRSFSKNYNEYRYTRYYDNGREIVEPNHSHKAAMLCGFSVDVGHDVYTYEGLGAFVTNVGENITSVEDMCDQYDEVIKCNPYHKILDMMKQGYEFCLGPAFPSKNGYINDHLVGLYCKNYLDMAEKENKVEI